MATPEGPAPPNNPLPPPASAASPPSGSVPHLPAGSTSTSSTSNGLPGSGGPKSKVPLEPLTGFRSALEHTGIPRSVLLWKPRLPSRNWLIFYTVVGSISGAYIYDRRESKRIKEETIQRVAWRANEPLIGGSLAPPRKVTVWGAKWGGDEDTDRALRHFRKYVKPYLVAAGIDYNLPSSPLHGSITRQVHSSVLSKRRQALNLEPTPPTLSLPGVLAPEEVAQRELEGGVVLVGRASLKEYLEGLKRGWMGGVAEWDWEKEVEGKLAKDGVFDNKFEVDSKVDSEEVVPPVEAPVAAAVAPQPPKPSGALSFLSRPAPAPTPVPAPFSSSHTFSPTIPEAWHVPPSPLPAQPPILLVPFTNHLGFTQVPNMIISFFTERKRVKQGSEAALALIENHIRPFTPSIDIEFDKDGERYYGKAAKQLPSRIEEARKDYYTTLKERVDSATEYEYGKREMTDAEKKAGKVERLDELKEERKKKELRWMGNLEGWDIVKPDSEPTWDSRWDGWLQIFELPSNKDQTRE